MIRSALLVIVFSIAALPMQAAETLRVLFVGNSLTYFNDMPFMVAALSKGEEIEIEVGVVALPNAGLEDHWAEGTARKEIASRRWDVVVMQQGPSSLASSRANLVEWSRKFASAARDAGVRPALYTVWPDSSRRAYLDDVIESYRTAAESCECELLPAGAAWREAWNRSGRLSLYGADGFHPSEEGSYLAALVIWGALTGADVMTAPAELKLTEKRTIKVKEKRARIYRDAAAAVIDSATGHR